MNHEANKPGVIQIAVMDKNGVSRFADLDEIRKLLNPEAKSEEKEKSE